MADRNCPSAKWWHLAKSLCGLGNNVSPTVAPLLNESQSAVFDDRAKADLFKRYICKPEQFRLNPHGFPNGPTHLKSVFRLKHIPASDVKKAIQRLPNKMSTGSDLISYRLLKAAGPGIVGPLTTLFNLSLKRGEVPNEWKHSVVCPIFKGGRKDRRVPTNYRPISLTSCVARIMENSSMFRFWITFSHTPFFISINLAFLPTHSTVTQLIYLTNKWQMALEKGNHVQAAFLDLSGAHDRVSIPGLLYKLSALGFSTESLKWFSSFHQDRTQCVRVNGTLSFAANLKSGIPQGTVLINIGPGPVLNIHKRLPSVVENESSIFADDTTMFYHSVKTLAYSCKSLTLDLNAASHWAKVWGMLYNAEKSQHLTVRSKHVRVSSPPVSMGGVTVPQVDHHKHLGVHLNKSLTWTDHVNQVFSSCARRIGMLRRLRRILPNAAIRRIYVGSIRPILEYTCPVWCEGPIAKLVKLQESFCRRHHVTIPPVKKRFDYHTLILFYKIKSNLAPAYLTELLPSPSHNSGHTFRKELYPVPLVKKINLSPSLVFCHARLFFGIAYRQNCRRAPLLARLSPL